MVKLQRSEQVAAFVDRLCGLSPGDRARLRRAAGKTISESHAIDLAYRVLPYGLGARREELYFLLATVYPLADSGSDTSLGVSLWRARDRDPNRNRGLDRRVQILLDADAGQLPFRLQHVIRYLKSKGVRVNWEALLNDLLRWEYANRPVQKRWAAHYFGHQEAPPVPAQDEGDLAAE